MAGLLSTGVVSAALALGADAVGFLSDSVTADAATALVVLSFFFVVVTSLGFVLEDDLLRLSPDRNNRLRRGSSERSFSLMLVNVIGRFMPEMGSKF